MNTTAELPADLAETVEARLRAASPETRRRFLVWLLTDPDHGVAQFAAESARPVIRAVADLHRRAICGGPIPLSTWTVALDDADDVAYDVASFDEVTRAAALVAAYAAHAFASPTAAANAADVAACVGGNAAATIEAACTARAGALAAQLEKLRELEP